MSSGAAYGNHKHRLPEKLTISIEDLQTAGGNETAIPKKFDDILYPLGWREIRITGDLLVKLYPRRANQRGRFSDEPFDEKTITGYIDGHNIDFIKGKVAFVNLQWKWLVSPGNPAPPSILLEKRPAISPEHDHNFEIQIFLTGFP